MYCFLGIISVTDYYPYGSPMPGRQWNSSGSVNGYNGMRKDEEWQGGGNAYDFGARIYDPRLGRWLSGDPNFVKYPSYSPYAFAVNSPLQLVDYKGMDPIVPRWLWHGNGYLAGYMAGLADALWENVSAVIDIQCAGNPFNPCFYTPKGSEARAEYQEMLNLAYDLLKDEELRKQVWQSLKEALGDWWDDASFQGDASEAGYAHGQAVMNLALGILGAAELKAILQTGKISINALKSIHIWKVKELRISKFVNIGDQEKHIRGKNNYKVLKGQGDNPSILEKDPQELLDKLHSGDVKRIDKISDSKTRVDFGEVIGKFVDEATGEEFDTTIGIVHTGKKGSHIVPAKPIN